MNRGSEGYQEFEKILNPWGNKYNNIIMKELRRQLKLAHENIPENTSDNVVEALAMSLTASIIANISLDLAKKFNLSKYDLLNVMIEDIKKTYKLMDEKRRAYQ